ncbi:MAG: terpene cyclase/mutase family protein [Planctomycetes bacterium]|nr:terpene cyclase/mutase family protein [Planctomycetota bacterium]
MSPIDRRAFLACGAAWAVSAHVLRRSSGAQDHRPDRVVPEFVQPETGNVIREGLDFLAERQNEEGCFGTEGYRRNVAVVSLAGLAFMANGSAPGRGPYGRHVNRCLSFVLKHAREDGFIVVPGSSSHGPMYEHGFATLFLAEAHGMYRDSNLREALARAASLIAATQNQEGGWRYRPERHDADISVTICQVMALRAARNAGIFVSNETIDRCTDYVKQCQNPDGGFAYMLPREESRFPRTAAGIVALYSAGIYEGDEIRRGLEYLMKHKPEIGSVNVDDHFFYGHYYAVQATWLAGGAYWREWYPAIRKVLLARRREDGSWFDQICPEYGTAMACMILQMPNNYLPIFER